MTPEQFKAAIQKRFDELKGGELLLPVVQALVPKIADRIFIEGKNSAGGKIGSYSTTPMYAQKKKFHKQGSFRPQGKGEHMLGQKRKTTTVYDIKSKKSKAVAVKNGNQIRKTMYLVNGYKELRAIQGDESGFVNLNYRGILHTDFVSHIAVNGNFVEVRLARETSRKKVQGNEARFGSIFKLTKQEREFYAKEANKHIVKIMNN